MQSLGNQVRFSTGHVLLNSSFLFALADFEGLIRELFKPQLEELFGTQSSSRFTSDDFSSLLESPTNPPVTAQAVKRLGIWDLRAKIHT